MEVAAAEARERQEAMHLALASVACGADAGAMPKPEASYLKYPNQTPAVTTTEAVFPTGVVQRYH